jgi:hypothetical protein
MEELDIYFMVHNLLLLPAQWGTWQKNSSLQGVMLGDPFSPYFSYLLWSISTDFSKAQTMGFLSSLYKDCDSFRASLYADAAAIFIKPTFQDIKITSEILKTFVEASEIIININKT